MGPVIVDGRVLRADARRWAWEPFVASVPIGLLVAAILHANNVRDIENDRRNHKWTLAALAGRPLADYEFVALMLGGYAVVVAMTIAGAAPWPVLVTLLHAAARAAARPARDATQQSAARAQRRAGADGRAAHAVRGAAGVRIRGRGVDGRSPSGARRRFRACAAHAVRAAVVAAKQARRQPRVRAHETAHELHVQRADGAVPRRDVRERAGVLLDEQSRRPPPPSARQPRSCEDLRRLVDAFAGGLSLEAAACTARRSARRRSSSAAAASSGPRSWRASSMSALASASYFFGIEGVAAGASGGTPAPAGRRGRAPRGPR